MSETRNVSGAASSQAPYVRDQPEEVVGWTAWTGWVVFAGIMMIMLGSFQAIMGLVALFESDYYLVTPNGLAVSIDYSTWGWIHLLLGLVAIGAGIGVLAGQLWGRIVGIVMAVVSTIVNISFIAAYPVWTIIVVTLDVIVIYALVVHGKEVRAYDA